MSLRVYTEQNLQSGEKGKWEEAERNKETIIPSDLSLPLSSLS